MESNIRHVSNPPNPYDHQSIEWLDEPPKIELQIFVETAKSILSKNTSPDIPFTYSLNPYRGCFHGCAYCYARPSHQYLGFGAGTDFERKLVVKTNAAELLVEEFEKKSWKGDRIVFSGNTDCYQPLEAVYGITRKCLEVCLRYQNPVDIITKGALIRRDLDILQALTRNSSVRVYTSLAFSDDEMARKIEPFAPRPSIRFRAIQELTSAGVEVGLALAPIIPGLNDSQIPDILKRAKEAGVSSAFLTLIRLPAETQPVFLERLAEEFPERSKKVVHGIRESKQGMLNRSEFSKRMRGEGERWKAIEWLFHQTCKQLGILTHSEELIHAPTTQSTFSRPNPQLSLF